MKPVTTTGAEVVRTPGRTGLRLEDVVGRVLDLHAARTTELADTLWRIPAANYVAEERFAREQVRLFRETPVFACLSSDVGEPGAFFTLESGGLPIVVLRRRDGTCAAFVNACSHRAAPVFEGRGRTGRSVSCPFHGWTYRADDGRLAGRPKSCGGFEGLVAADCGLVPVAVAERHGLVVVRPGSREPIDVDGWLDGMGVELGSLPLADYVLFKESARRWQCNWKLLLDTFFESYHIFALHRKSLGSSYLGIASPLETYGVHMRLVIPRSTILDQAPRPEEERDLFADAVVQYCLAPAAILSFLYGYLMVWRFTPLSAGSTLAESALYTLGAVDDESARAAYEERFASAIRVTEQEDYPISERIHRNLASGAVGSTVLGRNEAAAVHFHREIDRRLADL